MSTPPGRIERYEIRIVGRLAPRWAASFDGMTITAQDDGTTTLRGPVPDQSALHGLIRRLSDLGLPLVSVIPAADDGRTDRSATQHVPSRRSTP